MPTVPAIPPHDRFFARLERFQCACPSCGRLLTSSQDQGFLVEKYQPKHSRPHAQQQRLARRVKDANKLVWNPFTQRLRCPWCQRAFVAGLLLYPVKPGSARITEQPPDVTKIRRDRLEERNQAGGWQVEEPYVVGQHVNLMVEACCSCPPRGWASDCPLHGQPAEVEHLP